MVQLYAIVTKLGQVYFRWFVLLRSASMELAKEILSSNVESGSVQTSFLCVPHFVMISYILDDALYFGGTSKSDYRCCLGFHTLQIIIVVIMVRIKCL